MPGGPNIPTVHLKMLLSSHVTLNPSIGVEYSDFSSICRARAALTLESATGFDLKQMLRLIYLIRRFTMLRWLPACQGGCLRSNYEWEKQWSKSEAMVYKASTGSKTQFINGFKINQIKNNVNKRKNQFIEHQMLLREYGGRMF